MDKENIAYEFLNTFRRFKKLQIKNIIKNIDTNNTVNETNMLLVISELIKKEDDDIITEYNLLKATDNNKIHLNLIREKMLLAPSTISPIIASLENKGYILKEIDKQDKRNTYITLTNKGINHTNQIKISLINNIKEYIEYMGQEDIVTLINLLKKSNEYILNNRKD